MFVLRYREKASGIFILEVDDESIAVLQANTLCVFCRKNDITGPVEFCQF